MISLKKVFLSLVLGSLLPLPVFAAANSFTCNGALKSREEVGRFLQNICAECYERGDCGFRDVEVVLINVSNVIFGFSGMLILSCFVLGGVYFMLEGYHAGYREKGTKVIKGATIGLLAVIGAYTIVYAFRQIIHTGDFGVSSQYVICDGTETTEGAACAEGKICAQGGCYAQDDVPAAPETIRSPEPTTPPPEEVFF